MLNNKIEKKNNHTKRFNMKKGKNKNQKSVDKNK